MNRPRRVTRRQAAAMNRGRAAPMTARKRLKVVLAAAAGTLVMRLAGLSVRIQCPPYAQADALRSADGRPGLIFGLWHGDHFPVLLAQRGRGIHVITSKSADGEILTRILNHFGYPCIRGSSSRGGTRALVDLVRALRDGCDVAIALDGPKGPRRRAKPGVVLLAKLSGAAIVPVGAASRRHWEIGSWDRYRIPKPFTRALIVAGEPVRVPRDADDDLLAARLARLEQAMHAAQEQAEQQVRGV